MTYRELSVDPAFMEEYVSAMFLPHTDCGRFPGACAALGVQPEASADRGLRRSRWPARAAPGRRPSPGSSSGRSAGRAGSPILAVDADPNTSLDVALGLRPGADDLGRPRRHAMACARCPATMPKSTYLEYQLEDCLAEGRGVDLDRHGPAGGAGLLLRGQPPPAQPPRPADGRLPLGGRGQRGGHGAPQPPDDPRRGPAPGRQRRRRWSGSGPRSRIRALVGELSLTVRASALVVNRAAELPAAGGAGDRRGRPATGRPRARRPAGRRVRAGGPPAARAARRCARGRGGRADARRPLGARGSEPA